MCTFLTHLTAKLVLAEGGDEVRANERRQGAMRMHAFCRLDIEPHTQHRG